MSSSPSIAVDPQHNRLRFLTRVATAVAVMTSPAVFIFLHRDRGWSIPVAFIATILTVMAYRGFIDVAMRKLISWPKLWGADQKTMQENILARRRHWFWLKKFRFVYRTALTLGFVFAALVTVVFVAMLAMGKAHGWTNAIHPVMQIITALLPQFIVQMLPLAMTTPLFFVANILMMFGPLIAVGVMQIRGYEPGDAEWGVKLDDVRGQKEAKDEVAKIVSLWQAGDDFIAAGGRPERGLLFCGAPGVGKTLLAKALASASNCPFVTMPGSGFASAFMGVDVILVRYLGWKAKRLARKWGGQCIVFIDEIDAIGMRRAALGSAGMTPAPAPLSPLSFEEHAFHGPWGAINPSGDLILETASWRNRLFETRGERNEYPFQGLSQRARQVMNYMMPGGMGMGGGALNQLLVMMDGVGDAPFMRRALGSKLNTWLDATYLIPQRIGKLKLRLPPSKPASEQVYFIGATNVPLEHLDPALIRPGRMGRHVWFRTPTQKDRLDILDLYLGKISHEPELDAPEVRDELARITNGYSPASIQQACSLALTYAQHDGRTKASTLDFAEAMVVLESGTIDPVEYSDRTAREVAIHEAGHAICAHVYMDGAESTRLSIRKRGGSLGHHQALDKEERFSTLRSEEFARLIWGLGAMAAERLFLGQNSTGVGGDVQMVTSRAAWMVGSCAMGPEPVAVPGAMDRFQQVGSQIVARSGGGGMMGMDPIGAALSDRDKKRAVEQLLGQAYVCAYALVKHNQQAIERIASVLVDKREIYGNELLRLLDESNLEIPKLDFTSEDAWPTETLMYEPLVAEGKKRKATKELPA